MEYFSIIQTETGIQIEGFPDAEKLLQIDGPKARQLNDLVLHNYDLKFASDCLDNLNHVSESPLVLRQALWQCSISTFMKCFGHSVGRNRLKFEKIYKGDIGARTAFDYFKALRNKHLIHDENSYAQCITGAVLNKKDNPKKIEKVICSAFIGETLKQENYGNLHKLIKVAKEWVEVEIDRLCEDISKELEASSYEELYNRGSITYRPPKLDDIDKNRIKS